MSKRDYYEVLGVAKNANDATIKKSYKRLAMKHHPDRNTDNKAASEKKFKELQMAYSVLIDKQKRATYDQFGHDAVNGAAGGSPFGGGGFNANFNSNFSDMFKDAFGRQHQQSRGNDLRYDLEIDLKQAANGTTVKIRIPKDDSCEVCDGSGAKPGSNIQTCRTCHGSGQIHIQQGIFAMQQTCNICRGSGEKIESPCTNCHGHGVVRTQKTLSVKIPPGVDNGNRVRLNGEGEAVKGAQSGDLYVQIHIKPHNIFQRQGHHLLCEVPIDFISATLGDKIEVPTLNDRVKIKIPAGTQTGKQFRLKGKGIKVLQGHGHGVGDLICQVKVEIPVNLNKAQTELLSKFADSCGIKHYPESSTFFGKMKDFFN